MSGGVGVVWLGVGDPLAVVVSDSVSGGTGTLMPPGSGGGGNGGCRGGYAC